MAPRREILDSDDDGSAFGDEADAGDVETRVEQVESAAPRDASRNAGSDLTDPSFFRRIYDEQQVALDTQDAVPDTAPFAGTAVSSAPPPGQNHPAKDPSSLTSITDPTPGSRRSKRATQSLPADVIDLTDITTPRKSPALAESDVWDVPASARSQRSTRTYGKRKTAMQQLSLQEATPDMPPTQDPYAFPESSPPAGKQTRLSPPSSSAQHAPASSPVMLVPTAEVPVSSDKRPRSSRRTRASHGAEPSATDTASSLYITQSALTASQKQEYQTVSLSSEATLEVPDTLLPAQFRGEGEVYKSSGTTTIAYPTPSRIGSSRRAEEVPLPEADGGGVAGASTGQVYYQQSSPDVLTDMSATNTVKLKRSRTKVASSAGLTSSKLEPPPSTRRTKRRKVVQDQDETWGQHLDSAGVDTEPPQPVEQQDDSIDPTTQPEPAMAPEAESADAIPADTPPSNPAAKSKRGRKKKGSQPTEGAPPNASDTSPLTGEIQEPEPITILSEVEATELPPSTKRKRGRPRKSELNSGKSAQTQAETQDEPQQQQQPLPDEAQPLSVLPPNSQRAAPSQSHVGETTATTNDGDGDGGDAFVEDGKENVSSGENDDARGDVHVKKAQSKPEKGGLEKPGGKQAAAAAALPQKVRYRVGLSKRSRIAPLLKSVRKP